MFPLHLPVIKCVIYTKNTLNNGYADLSDMLVLLCYLKAGKADFEYLERKVLEWGEPKVPSAKQVRTHQVVLCDQSSVFYLLRFDFALNEFLIVVSLNKHEA